MLTANSKRRVLITGGASGIGRAVLNRFAEGGWNIFCHYCSDSPNILKLQNEMSQIDIKFELLQADLSTEDGIAMLINKAKSNKIDTLINNAGAYIHQKHFAELKLSELSLSFMLNLAAPFAISSALFQDMRDRKFGRIVNISSIAAKYGGSAFSMHYGCMKRGLEGIALTLSREGAQHNVLVNNVRPGVIDTAFHNKFPKDMHDRVNMIPAKRMGLPQEVAELVYYLGSEVNTYICGQTLAISGGE
ncbi:MAG: SDR family oxidoreductase [Dissulfurispiraceae bacterium]|jgi:3-oxoacyl-[acyl-carrier protein] reductase|nr:SDR family oxidoreductase [Dissulfurispiraceae bacterium]